MSDPGAMMMMQRWCAGLVACLSVFSSSGALAQIQPTYSLVEAQKRTFGRASQDFRGIGKVDFWFVGHDPSDGPLMAVEPGFYARKTAFTLLQQAVDGSNTDRHQCGFLHLDTDALIDMVCALGAEKGTGSGPNEVYRNTSSATRLAMTRIEGAGLPTGIEDLPSRSRALVPFRFADGGQGVWSVVAGSIRADGQPNINRLYRYNGPGTFRFTEQASPAINIASLHTCGRVGDLNGDGLDDLLLCRLKISKGEPAGSLLYRQQADGSFLEVPLPMAWTGFVDAEIEDLNGDGRKDLVASVDKSGGVYRIEVYLQTAPGSCRRCRPCPSTRRPGPTAWPWGIWTAMAVRMSTRRSPTWTTASSSSA